MPGRLPNLFVVGAPKCGTTALHVYLKAHDDVFMTDWKEPHYFSKDLHTINGRSMREEDYFALFAAADAEKWVGESSPSYLLSKSAAAALKRFSPDARIIVMLRDPVEVMYAFHATQLQMGVESVGDFEEALGLEEARRNGEQLPAVRSGLLENLFYREVVRFTDQVKRYFDAFGRDRVHVIIYDDLKRDTAVTFEAVLRFLGLLPQSRLEFQKVNENVSPRSVTINNFLWNPPRSLRRLARALVPDAARRKLVVSLLDLNKETRSRSPMPDQLRLRLQREFAPEVERLSALLNVDLTHWSRS
jgi:hypothetical protein